MSQLTYQADWSPKDPHHLKRRHTRGNTARSLLDSRSSSPALSTLSDDFMCNSQRFDGHSRIKSNKSGNLHFDDPFYPYTEPSCASSSPPSSTNRSRTSTATPSVITSSHSTSLAPNSSTPSPSVPTWFGSLRSFAISASTSSRGAFAPLVTSSSSSSSSLTSHTPSRGKSSSIYYAGSSIMDPYDSDDNDREDEPITDRNGLKENRVRGPRKSWSVFDPSVGGLFPQTYSAVPTTSEPDLSSPSTCSSSSSSLHSPTDSQIEELGIPDEGYCVHDQDCYKETSHVFYSSSSSSSPSIPTPTSSSAFSMFKSYVPSILPGFDSRTAKGPIALSDDHTPTSSPKPSTPTTTMASDAPNTGFWSLRKLTMNFMSNNQYEQVGSFEDEKEEDPSEVISPDERYRDDLEDESDGSKKASASGSAYLSSVITSSMAMGLPVSNSVRDRLERLPGGGLQSVKKIGRLD
ncbi:hypothetical protein CPB97_002898 [Podila verticillata]|nr:hypothetical protein CPB97_002898 [Podila verticillata]